MSLCIFTQTTRKKSDSRRRIVLLQIFKKCFFFSHPCCGFFSCLFQVDQLFSFEVCFNTLEVQCGLTCTVFVLKNSANRCQWPMLINIALIGAKSVLSLTQHWEGGCKIIYSIQQNFLNTATKYLLFVGESKNYPCQLPFTVSGV